MIREGGEISCDLHACINQHRISKPQNTHTLLFSDYLGKNWTEVNGVKLSVHCILEMMREEK